MTSNDSMTSSTFQGIEKILMSYLSLIKQTGQVCWQTIDQATLKTPLEDLHYKKTRKRGFTILSFHVQFQLFLQKFRALKN